MKMKVQFFGEYVIYACLLKKNELKKVRTKSIRTQLYMYICKGIHLQMGKIDHLLRYILKDLHLLIISD